MLQSLGKQKPFQLNVHAIYSELKKKYCQVNSFVWIRFLEAILLIGYIYFLSLFFPFFSFFIQCQINQIRDSLDNLKTYKQTEQIIHSQLNSLKLIVLSHPQNPPIQTYHRPVLV